MATPTIDPTQFVSGGGLQPFEPPAPAAPAVDPWAGFQEATPDDIAEATGDPWAGFQEADGIDLATPEELAADRTFNVVQFVKANPEVLDDPAKSQTLLEAYRRRRIEGITSAVVGEALKAAPAVGKEFLKGARDLTERLIEAGLQPTVNVFLNATEDPAIRGELLAETKRRQKKAVAEIAAGSESAAFGIANLFRTGKRKLATSSEDLAKMTPEQIRAQLLDDVAFAQQAEDVVRGQGAAAEAIGLDADQLAKEGIELDPAAIESISFVDPLSLIGTGGALSLVTKTGRVVAKVKTVQQATRLAQRLGTTVARAVPAVAGKTIQATGQATRVAGRGVERAGQAARTPLKVAGGVAGAVKGLELAGAAGAVAGLAAGSRGGATLARGVEALGRGIQSVGGRTIAFGRQVAGEIPKGRLLRAAGVAARVTGPTVAGAAIGAASGLPLALATDTDEEAAQLLAGGIALGGGAGAVFTGARGFTALRDRVVGQRLLEPFERTQPPVVRESPDYGLDPNMDAIHRDAFQALDPGSQAAVNEFRELMRGDGEIYVQDASNYAQRVAEIMELEKGAPLNAQELAAAQEFGQTRAVFSLDVPTPEGPRKVVFLNKDASGLPHDAGHLFEAVLPDSERIALREQVASLYTPEELGAFKRLYEDALNQGQAEGAPRRTLTDEHLIDEIIAENFSALFANVDVSQLGTPRPLVDRMIQLAASWAEKAGVDLGGGRTTPAFPLRQSVTVQRMLENAARRRAAALPEPQVELSTVSIETPSRPLAAEEIRAGREAGTNRPLSPEEIRTRQTTPQTPEGIRNKRVTPEEQAATAAIPPAGANIELARSFAREAKDPKLVKVVEDIAAAFERKRGQVSPLEFEVLGAKESEPGKPQGRLVRLEERLAADFAEAAGTAPEDVRQLFQAVQVPVRFETVGRGANRKLQLLGMSLDKVMANVGIVAREASKRGIGRILPYDVVNGAMTPDAWRRFQKDLIAYTENQQNGFRGDGRRLTRPPDELGVVIPEENPSYNPTVLPEDVGNFLNLIQGIAPPRTARVTGPGVPGNIKARTIAELQLRPVETPAQIALRDVAKQQFPTGEFIGEVNPLRNELAREGVPIRDLHEVTERFRVDRIKSVKPRSELQFRAPLTDVVRAGFLPEPPKAVATQTPDGVRKDAALFLPVVRIVDDVATAYAEKAGINYTPRSVTSRLRYPRELGKEIAKFYDDATHAPNDPAVQAAYEAFSRETEAQAQAILDAGVSLEPVITKDSPYKNAADVARDVRDNKRLRFNLSEAAFGELSGADAIAASDNLLLRPSGITLDGKVMNYNDLFRAVHDFFGHSREGFSFGPEGELNAFRNHLDLYSDAAKPAIGAEALGQTAWTQFGPHLLDKSGKVLTPRDPGFTPRQERPFATQKNFLMPEELIDRAMNAPEDPTAAKFLPAEPAAMVMEVARLGGDEFKKAMDSQEGGLTGAAVRLGKKFNSPEQVEILSVLEEQAKTQMREALTSGRMDEAMLLASKPQFFREARESATGTGSIGAAEARGGQFLPRKAPIADEAATDAGRQLIAGGFRIAREPASGVYGISVYDGETLVADITARNVDPTTASIDNVFVDPDYRGRGISEVLYRETAADMQAAGVARVTGNVISDIPLRVRQKVFGDFEEVIHPVEGSMSGDAAIARLRESREARERGDTSSIEFVNPVSRVDPQARFAPRTVEKLREDYSSEPSLKVGVPAGLNKVLPGEETFTSAWVSRNGDAYEVPQEKAAIYHGEAVDAFSEFEFNKSAVGDKVSEFQDETGSLRLSNASSLHDAMDFGATIGISVSKKPSGAQMGYLKRLLSEINEDGSPAVSSIGVDVTARDGTVIAAKTFSITDPKRDFGAINRFLRDPYSDETAFRGQRLFETGPEKDARLSDVQSRFLTREKKAKKLPLPPKAFIEPDGTFTTVTLATHDQFLLENRDRYVKKYNVNLPKTQGKGDPRIPALNKGFVRVTYEPNQGRLVYEANVKTFGKTQRDKIFEHVIDNLDSIDNLTVSLVDDQGRVKKSASRRFFNMEDDQKLDSIPFVTDEGLPERSVPFFLPREQVLRDDNFSAEVERIAKGEKEGETFNLDGTIFAPGDRKLDVVTVASRDIPVSELNPETVKDAVMEFEAVLENENVKTGLFRIQRKTVDGEDQVSVDINAVVPQEFRENTEAFARANNQESFFDLVKFEVVDTGGTGETVLKTPAEIAEAVGKLVAGDPVEIPAPETSGPQFLPRRQQELSLDVQEPTAPRVFSRAARSSMNREQLRKAFPEAVIPRKLDARVPYDITGSPLYRRTKGGEADKAKAFSERLVEKYRQHENEPETRLGLRWYEDFIPLLKARYGEDAGVFAELLAATSPNTTPRVNYQFAEAAFKRWKAGDFDPLIAKYREGLDKLANGTLERQYKREVRVADRPENITDASLIAWWIDKHDLLPRQVERISKGQRIAPKFGMHSEAVLKVITRQWLNENRGLKTNNFVRNLTGESEEATIDLWAARTMREAGYSGFVDRWRILPENSVSVSDADFNFSQAAFREAAKELGIKPRQLQGALWFIEKKNWASKGWGELDLGDYRTEIKRMEDAELPDPQAELF